MIRIPLLLVLCTATVAGCAPCTESCNAEAKIFERCLDEWGLEWADLGADEEEDFRDRCSSSTQTYVSSLDTEAARVTEQRCSELAGALRDESDCEAAWETLVSYGVEP